MRFLRALLAAVVILVILIGLPAALWFLGRPLLPDAVPSWAHVAAALTRPDDGRLLLGFLVLVGVIAWALLALSILAELASVAAQRPVLRLDLPGLRMSRGIAAGLVAAVLGLAGTPAFASPAVAAAAPAVSAPVDPGAPRAMSATDPQPRGPVYIVMARDTLWSVAENELGDPLRWREIYDLNVHRLQPDGSRLTEASRLVEGWILVLPHDARQHDPGNAEPSAGEEVVVEPGDTLSELAETNLHDGHRADELFLVNQGVRQRDGGALIDPDLIRPGWVLTLPAAEPDAGTGPPEDHQPPAADPGDHPAPTPAPPTSVDGPPTSTPPAATPTPGAPSGSPPTSAEPNASAPGDSTARTDGADVLPVVLGASSVLVGGIVTTLAVRRRRQLRHRAPGHRIAAPGDQAGRVEWHATQSADRSTALALPLVSPAPPEPPMDDERPPADRGGSSLPPLDRLDIALRSLTLSDWQGGEPPDLCAVALSGGDAVLALAEPTSMPEPFAPTDREDRWLLTGTAELPLSEEEANGFCSPYPALVSVAGQEGGTARDVIPGGLLFVDLERAGVTWIRGADSRVDQLVRHITAELATARWADDVEVLVDRGSPTTALPDMAPLNPERVRVVDVAAGLAEIGMRIQGARRTVRDSDTVDSVLEGRLRNAFPLDGWLPVVLIIRGELASAERDAVERLAEELADGPRLGVAVVVADADLPKGDSGTQPGTLISVDADGVMHVEPAGLSFGEPVWQAASLDAATSDHLVDLLDAVDRPDVLAGPAQGDWPWAQDMAEDGSLRPQRDAPTTQVAPRTGDGRGEAEPERNASAEAVRLLEIVDHQDRGLSEDLARWLATEPTVPLISVLGVPQVRAPGTAPTARTSWFVEVLVYLCFHPGGVTMQQALTDLWPQTQSIKMSTVRHAFYGARRWAGLYGEPPQSFVTDMLGADLYKIRGHLLDWDLFRRLRKRAQARQAAENAGAIDDYRAALGLVRGPVLSGLRPRGYAWLNNHHERHDLQIPGFIVDTAHELVDIALSPDDPAEKDLELARWAAETARRIDIDSIFDEPLTDLMRVADLEGNTAEMERYAAILLDARGMDVPEELPPRTFAVLDKLLPDGPRRSRPRPPG
jgi:hypothetical protein